MSQDRPARLTTLIKAARELGLSRLALYGLYQFGLRSGHYRRVTPCQPSSYTSGRFSPLFHLLTRDGLANLMGLDTEAALTEAGRICEGEYRPFGGDWGSLEFPAGGDSLPHWTEYALGRVKSAREDVKWVWEPARFGWVFPLCRAFQLTGQERFVQCFWQNFAQFDASNPPNRGENWESGQEVSVRLMALAFALQVFAPAQTSTQARQERICQSIAEHAERILPTLPYGRAQHNNHLLVEAAGLYTAGCLLPEHPQAATWKATGWKWFQNGAQTQIAANGSYVQHSTNYHRVMLTTALWMQTVATARGEAFPTETLQKLAAATRWLAEVLDENSGRVPNLGSNDGALLFPLCGGEFGDFRPIAQACALAFEGQACLAAGTWDELSLWLSGARPTADMAVIPSPSAHYKLVGQNSHASLRAMRYTSRPAHADQMQVDLWWHGENLLLDAGSYLYNGAVPWENSLASASVHNSPMLDDSEPMTRAGKFLWLDWDQAHVLAYEPDLGQVKASHNGYRHMGVEHQRELRHLGNDHWLITDALLSPHPEEERIHLIRLQWLVPDLPWQMEGQTLLLSHPDGKICIRMNASEVPQHVQVIRAGQVILGLSEALPTLGWYSPTYACKVPALALRFTWQSRLPFQIQTAIEPAE